VLDTFINTTFKSNYILWDLVEFISRRVKRKILFGKKLLIYINHIILITTYNKIFEKFCTTKKPCIFDKIDMKFNFVTIYAFYEFNNVLEKILYKANFIILFHERCDTVLIFCFYILGEEFNRFLGAKHPLTNSPPFLHLCLSA